MIIRKIIRSHYYQTLLRFKNPSEIPHLISSNSIHHPSCRLSISFRPFSFLAHFQSQECAAEPITPQNVVEEKEKLKKPLGVYFREAVGLLEKTPEDNETGLEGEDENAELKKKLRKLEEGLRLSMENLENAKQKEKKGAKRVEELFKNVSPVETGSAQGKKSGGLSLSSVVEGEDENAELKKKLKKSRKLEEGLTLSMEKMENLKNAKQKEEKGAKRVEEIFKNVSPVETGSAQGKKSGGLSLSSVFEGEDENAELKKKSKKSRKLEEGLTLSMENLENAKQKEEKGAKRVDELFKNVSPVETGSAQGKESGGLSLSSLFVGRVGRDREMKEKEVKIESSRVYKPLSPDMEKFVIHLYKNGYFKDSNFLPRNRFDIACFENSYGKDYVRYAAEQFGRDNRPISK